MYFASKSLTTAQQNYVAIELEALAVSWAVQKFHHYLYVRPFMLQTDQKTTTSYPQQIPSGDYSTDAALAPTNHTT